MDWRTVRKDRPLRLFSALLGTDDGHERDASARRATEVVGEAQGPVGLDLTLGGSLATQLEPALEHHAQPGGTDGVAEALQATVGVDGQLTVEIEGSGEDFFPRHATVGEAQVLHEDELGRGEAVVHLRHRDLCTRVGDASLLVGVLGGTHDPR